MSNATVTCRALLALLLFADTGWARDDERALFFGEQPAVPAKPARRVVVQQAPRAKRSVTVQTGWGTFRVTLEPPEAPAPSPVPRADDDDLPAAQAPRAGRPNGSIVESDNFDRLLYGSSDPQAAITHLDKLLRARVNRAAREHRLTDPEREKLRLAGAGDTKRFFDRVEADRADFEAARGDFNGAIGVLLRVQPLSEEFLQGPFGEDSLFAKTLRTIEASRPARRQTEPGRTAPGRATDMHRRSRTCMTLFVALIGGPAAWAQGPEGKVPALAAPKVKKPRLAAADDRETWVVGVQIGRTQQILTLERPTKPDPEREDELDEEQPPQKPPANDVFKPSDWSVERENFDRLLFGRGTDWMTRLEHLDRMLQARLKQEMSKNGLDRRQVDKLRLAGRGDIKRFLDRVDRLRADFDEARGDVGEAMAVLESVLRLGDQYKTGLLGDDSLFAKTLRTIQDHQVAVRQAD